MKIPHATEQLSLCATSIESTLYSWQAAATEPRATTIKACVPRACALQREKSQQ